MSCQNADFHNQCDHKDISSEKTLNSGIRMSEFVCRIKSRLMQMPVATSARRVRESKDISRFSAY